MSFQLDENELAEPESVNVSIVNKESNEKNSEFSRKNSNYQNNNFNNGPNINAASNKNINEPIQLIDFSRGFQVNPKAIEFLNSIKEDIIVVSVVGKARTGKSYLMNLLLDLIGNKEKYGFKVASSLQSCTKGIWLWGNAKNSLNGNAKIIFLDSEGTSSTDKSTKTYDSRIFALVVLISSLFLYNTYSNIDEHGISELSLAAHLSNAITTNSDINKDELLTQLAPNFIWIIRDFTLDKVHPETGEEITSKEYLELCLKNKRVRGGQDNNIIRQNIIKFFPERDCVTLIRPVDDESDLKRLNDIPFNNLKPQFKIEFKKLKDKIYKEALPKKYNGKKLNGPSLARLIEEFVNVINSGKIPNINNAWDSVIEKDINDYYNKALNFYREKIRTIKISQGNVYENDELLKKLLKYEYLSLNIYNSIKENNGDTLNHKKYLNIFEENKKKLIKTIENNQNKLLDQNTNYSISFNTNLFNESYQPFQNKLYNNKYTSKDKDDLNDDYLNVLNNFNEKSKGNKKTEIFFINLIRNEKNVVDYLSEMMEKEGKKNFKKYDNNYKLAQAEAEDKKNKKRVANAKANLNKNKIISLQNDNEKLKDEIDDLKDTLNIKQSQLEKLKEINKQKRLDKIKIEQNLKAQKEKENKLKGNNRKRENKEGCGCGCLIF